MLKQILFAAAIFVTTISNADAQKEPEPPAFDDALISSTDLPEHAIKILGNPAYKCSGKIAYLDETRVVCFENNGASIIDIETGDSKKVLEIGPGKLRSLDSFGNRWMVATADNVANYKIDLYDIENPEKTISNELNGTVLDVFEDGSKMLVMTIDGLDRRLEIVQTANGDVLSTWAFRDGIHQIEKAQLTNDDSAVAFYCYLDGRDETGQSLKQIVFLAVDKSKGEFGEVISKENLPSSRESVRLHSSNKGPFVFVVRGRGSFAAFNFLTGDRSQFPSTGSHIFSIDIDKHTSKLLTAGKVVSTWDPVTAKPLLSSRFRLFSKNACFSPSGKTFATNGGSRLRVWDSESGELLHGPSVEEISKLSSVAISANDDAVAVADSSGRVEVWDVKEEKRRRMAYSPTEFGKTEDAWISPHFLSFSKDQKFLLGGSDKTANLVNVWDTKTGASASRIPGHRQPIMAVAWSPDNRLIASTGRGGVVRLTSNTGQAVGKVRGWMVSAFLPDGKHIVTAQKNDSGKLDIFNLTSGTLMGTLVPPDGVEPLPYGLAVAPKGNLIAAAYQGGELVVWNYKTGDVVYEKRMEAEHYKSGMSSVSFSSDGETLAFASGGYEIWLLSAATGEEKLRLKETDNVRGLTFGKSVLATITPHHVTLWEPEF